MTAGKSGADVELCWAPTADVCVQGYRVLGADSPESALGFSTETDPGAVSCETFPWSGGYFLVVGRGGGGTGPWGHYGQ